VIQILKIAAAVFLLFLPVRAYPFLCVQQPHGFDSSSYDFGSVNVGSSGNITTTVHYWARCLYSSPVTATITMPSGFSASPSTFTIDQFTPVSVTITFSPTSSGIYTGTATISYSGGSPSATASLAGVGYQPQPNINLNPTSLDFGEVPVGSGATQTVVIANEGDAVLSGSISKTGPFNISAASFSINPGGSQTVSVTFQPTGRGSASGLLTISSNDPDASSLAVGLSGSGVAPYLSVSPSSHDFGTIPVGESVSTTITLSNLSDPYSAPLTLSSFVLSGSFFSFSNPGTVSLSPGESTTLQVTFSPGSAGTKNGGLSFSSNDPDNPSKTVGLAGTAVSPSIDPSTLNLSFGNVRLGTTATQTLTISNKGTSSLTVTGIASYTSAVTVAPASATIAAGGSQNFSVQYRPTAASLLELPYAVLDGDLTISSNDPQLPSLAIQMNGKGVSPYLNVSALDFGTVYTGDTRILSLTLENAGNETLVVSGLSSNLPLFVPAQSTVTVPAGETRTVEVQYHPSSEGTHTAALTLASNDTFSPSRTVAASGVAVPSLDLSVSGIEATQAIQDPDNSLPLVSGKKTVVRAFIDSTIKGLPNASNTIRNVDGLLHLYRGGVKLAGSPLKSTNGPIAVVPNPDRNKANETLNFVIPGEWTGGGDSETLDLQLEINPAAGSRVSRLLENSYGNNSLSRSLTFWKNYDPLIYYIPVTQTDPQGRPKYPLPPSAKMIQGAGLLKKMFPIPGIRYVQRPPLVFNKGFDGTGAGDLFAKLFFASHLGNVVPPDRTFGWLPEGVETGFAEDIPGRVAFGGRLSDLTGSVGGQLVFAHEIGHTYGLCHTHTMEHIENGTLYHCPVGYWDGHRVEDGTIGDVGFDIERGETVPPLSLADWISCAGSGLTNCPGTGAIDFMSYGPPKYKRWISPQRYDFLFSKLRSRLADPSNARGCNNRIDCLPLFRPALLVAGSISEEGEAEMQPIFEAESIPEGPPAEAVPSAYAVRFLDRDGNLLFEYPLDSSGMTGFQQTDRDGVSFSLVVPDEGGVETVQIVGQDGAVLLERSRSNHPPLLKLLSPSGGEVFDDLLEVAWEGSDKDQDRLTYSVLYSIDGGETFETIGIDLSGAGFSYDAAKLPGSDAAVVRLIASDGFNTVSVDSPPFRLSSKPPEVAILSPREGETVFEGVPLSLETMAVDPEEGILVGDRVRWRSDLSGEIGAGNPIVANLPLGTHTITVKAIDQDGNETVATVRIFVVPGEEAPRGDAGPDRMVGEGEKIMLDGSLSSDPNEGDTLAYAWSQIEGPAVAMSDAGAVNPAVTVPSVSADTLLRFLLTVTDPKGNVGTDFVDVTIQNIHFPSLNLSTTEIDFGTVPVGGSAGRSFVVSNTGDETLTVSAIFPSRPVFRAEPERLTLDPGASAEVRVTFNPDQSASYEGNLKIESDSVSGLPAMIVLKGTTPGPQIFHDDNASGGSLLPGGFEPAVDPSSSTPGPGGNGSVDPSPPPDAGSFGFVGTGGCSLMRQ
jgi:hypothetical protein